MLTVYGILQKYNQFFVSVFSASADATNSKWELFLGILHLC
ncbi:rCG50039, isoform CRA_c [Rattus norvegicus]|uniref:RCG50039, isoform CRA_c n=1 Tax=Rattus norvegicus TaxID=10116 RepID=A6JV86_RAT|nr:rCG50039, isoform CRA_c [Rattus norvegicus]EDM14968.1 rCG50039, isoform CRA_c [Rattus norvegicus]